MKKRSIALRLGVFALALTLITASLSSGTLAKFQTEFTGSGKFMVAKWDPTATITNGTSAALTTTKGFNLYETMTPGLIKNANALSANKIAPGAKGSFIVAVDANNADTGVSYQIKMYRSDEESKLFPENLIFWQGSDKDSGAISLSDTNEDNPADLGDPGTIAAGATGTTAKKEVQVFWEWPYDDAGSTGSGDDDDTLAGGDAGTFEFTVVVEMTQVDFTKAATP